MPEVSRRAVEGILFTDQYQLTMAQLYFRMGIHENTAQFEHYFRSYPDYGGHQAGYCVSAGLGTLLEWMEGARFGEEELAMLRSQRANDGSQLFHDDFLAWLRKNGSFGALSLQAIPEGRVVHPNTPLTVVRGPLAMAQIIETPLLNIINYQTLVATKAARIRESGGGQLVLEFGVRRGQGIGAIEGGRAALIGGADFTSDVGISHALGYQPKGTHAHAMIQAFMAMGLTELDAFRAYAEAYPDDCLLLVDTINTLESGVPNAIRVFEELRAKGHRPVGVRLDSGDLAYLTIEVAKMLDDAGFPEAGIVLSSNLDEMIIWQIKTQIREEAERHGLDANAVLRRLTYGVGTRLITSWGAPALGGVYKLMALQHQGVWSPAIKLSDSAEKTPNPGNKRLWRLYDRRGSATADLLTLEDEDPREWDQIILRHPSDINKSRIVRASDISQIEPVLADVLAEGKLVYDPPTLDDMRLARRTDVKRLDPGVKRLVNPHVYHVSLSQALWELKERLITEARAK
ncbi:nicotinate phosphoribosyltransferase [Chloroflexia bacterium SDU3-3]|nr:nicotinate phosphoribosyltransferase [Chloroflexia bacterium SDU3-3]